jgi:multidrug efflux pump subunit AcrB
MSRKIRVEIDPAKLAAYGLDALAIVQSVRGADARLSSGTFEA